MSHTALAQTAPVLLYRCQIPDWAAAAHLQAGLTKIPQRVHGEITRFKRLQDRLARLVARRLVSKALDASGLGWFSDLNCWQKDPRGRPFLDGCMADISISHSSPWAVAALVVSSRVGVDVESFVPLELDSFRDYLTEVELEDIANASDPARKVIECWALREAILKADGRGLLVSKEEIRDIHSMESSRGGQWHVHSIEIGRACICLATDRRDAKIEHRNWDLLDLL